MSLAMRLTLVGRLAVWLKNPVGAMPRPPEVGTAGKGECADDGAVEAEVAGGIPRQPEAAGADGVNCEHALGCTVDEENLVGATSRPPEVKIGSADALGEGIQLSKANTTINPHPPFTILWCSQ